MNVKIIVKVLVLAAFGSLIWQQVGMSQTVAAIPEIVVKDQNDLVLGGLSVGSGAGSIAVMLKDTVNNQNYHILLGQNRLRGFNTSDVWYTNADCTGTAYVQAPSTLGRTTAALRGATYAIGRKVGGGSGGPDEDSVIVRGAGAGSNQDAIINSRWRTNTLSDPVCSSSDPAIDVVQATQIADLSNFQRPWKID